MNLKIKLWGQLKQKSGKDLLDVKIDGEECLLEAAIKTVADQEEAISSFLREEDGSLRHSTLVFVDEEQVSWDDETMLKDGMELTLMSPIAGG